MSRGRVFHSFKALPLLPDLQYRIHYRIEEILICYEPAYESLAYERRQKSKILL